MFQADDLKQSPAGASLMQQRRAGGLLTEASITFMFFVIMASGVFIITMSLRNRQRLRELAMRERIAMIEKGLLPSPEVDPGRFDQFDRLERLIALRHRVSPSPSASRFRSLGIMMIGFGLAFTVLLTFAGGVVGAGLGIGGAFMILGAAMVVNSIVMSRTEIGDAPPPTAPMPPPEPPTNVAP